MTQRQRQTRPERERLEMAITVTRTGVASVTAALIKLALFASASGAATMATTGDWRQMLRAAGYVALVALLLFGLLAFLAVLAWLGTRGERAEAEGWNFGRYTRTSSHVLPDGVTEADLREYMIGIATGSVTLSQEGAAANGFDRVQANGIKAWCVAVGWYRVISEANNSGDWTRQGRQVLEMLQRTPPATWDEVIAAPPTLAGTG